MSTDALTPKWPTLAMAASFLAVTGCSTTEDVGAREGKDETSDHDDDRNGTQGATVPEGYSLRLLTSGLDFPTAIAIDDDRLWVAESGITGTPTVKAIDADGSTNVILDTGDLGEGELLAPLTDITLEAGRLWITHRQVGANGWFVGAISVFDPSDPVGTFRTVLTNLPAAGDHSVNDLALGDDGKLYFALGTATNTAVVGPDNELLTGWLGMFPDFHDFPALDIRLGGVEYESFNPLTTAPSEAITAPFMPFDSGPVDAGTPVRAPTPDDPVEGVIAGNGTVYRFDPLADDPARTLELVAWGLRNPFGIRFDPMDDDILYVTNNGSDIRGVGGEVAVPVGDDDLVDGFASIGNRPVANDYDDLFVVDLLAMGDEGKMGVPFYGWPDWFHDPGSLQPLPVTDPLFCSPMVDIDIPCPEFVLAEETRDELNPLRAAAQFELHSSANKLDVSTSEAFGHVGDLFVAETGSFVPTSGATQLVGYKVVRVDGESFEVTDFVTTGDTVEEIFDPQKLNKPIDVKFMGPTLLIVDFGIFEPGLGLQQPGTGKIWALSPKVDDDKKGDDDKGDDKKGDDDKGDDKKGDDKGDDKKGDDDKGDDKKGDDKKGDDKGDDKKGDDKGDDKKGDDKKGDDKGGDDKKGDDKGGDDKKGDDKKGVPGPKDDKGDDDQGGVPGPKDDKGDDDQGDDDKGDDDKGDDDQGDDDKGDVPGPKDDKGDDDQGDVPGPKDDKGDDDQGGIPDKKDD